MSKWPRSGKPAVQRQKEWRDKKRSEGYVHLQAWVKHEHRNKVKQFIKDLYQNMPEQPPTASS